MHLTDFKIGKFKREESYDHCVLDKLICIITELFPLEKSK